MLYKHLTHYLSGKMSYGDGKHVNWSDEHCFLSLVHSTLCKYDAMGTTLGCTDCLKPVWNHTKSLIGGAGATSNITESPKVID